MEIFDINIKINTKISYNIKYDRKFKLNVEKYILIHKKFILMIYYVFKSMN